MAIPMGKLESTLTILGSVVMTEDRLLGSVAPNVVVPLQSCEMAVCALNWFGLKSTTAGFAQGDISLIESCWTRVALGHLFDVHDLNALQCTVEEGGPYAGPISRYDALLTLWGFDIDRLLDQREDTHAYLREPPPKLQSDVLEFSAVLLSHTPKAYRFRVTSSTGSTNDIWMPKSLVKPSVAGNWTVPLWFVKKNALQYALGQKLQSIATPAGSIQVHVTS